MLFCAKMEVNNNYICLERFTLANLIPDMDNALIIGIIISKQQPRKLAKDCNRAVWNFTFRDSPRDYINVTCWGLKDAVFELYSKFQLDDVGKSPVLIQIKDKVRQAAKYQLRNCGIPVEIIKPRIQIRRINDYGEQFRPMVTSPYTLTLTETSDMRNYEGGSYEYYLSLAHLPTKPIAGFVALADVHRKCSPDSAITGLDLLGVVCSVGDTRNVSTKNGLKQVKEVVIFDHTSPGIRFSVWDEDLFPRVDSWTPRNTILFMTDMKAQWSQFHLGTIAVITPKTVITENPVGPEADALRQYAKNAPLQTVAILQNMTTSIPDPNTIQNVVSVKQVNDKVNYVLVNSPPGEQQFTALVYAMVTHLNLDSTIAPISKRCSNCQALIKREVLECENPVCPGGTQGRLAPYSIFDIRLSMTDHTGTWDNCRLSTRAAETSFGCNVQQFLKLGDEKRSDLKWRYLLERCAIRVLILLIPGREPLMSVLSLSLASPYEVTNKLPHY